MATPEAERVALDAIRALLPDECYVSRTADIRCTDYIGGKFPNGAEFTEEMCCLPCRIRAVLEPRNRPDAADEA